VTFSEAAIKLAGHAALLLGWKPDDFWDATPAELACIVSVMSTGADAVSGQTLAQLMAMYPDAPTGGE
jgi:uncharacterized phage protein (TIGR02216 family)